MGIDLMVRRKEMMHGAEKIPREFQEVEYIQQESENGYFLTNYYPNNKTTFSANMRFGSNTANDVYPTLFEAGEMFWLYKIGYYVWELSIGVKTISTNGKNAWRGHFKQWLTDNKWHLQTLTGETHNVYNVSAVGEFQAELPMVICGMRLNGEIVSHHRNADKARIVSLTFYEDGVEAMNLVPCYRHSDGEVGFYDTVGKTFLTKSGTGTFSAGPNV